MRILLWPGLVLLAAMMMGCTNAEKTTIPSSLERLSWLQGSWEMVEEDHTLGEVWYRVDDTTLAGYGCRVVGIDTMRTEALTIRARDGGLQYIADVPQNAEPVAFGLTAMTDSSAVFENPDHDLPNLISYQLESPDIVRVRVSGVRDGAPTGFELLFARVKRSGDSVTSITP